MLSYYLKYRKHRESKKSKVVKTKNGRTAVTSNCAICSSKNQHLFKSKKLLGY